MIPSGVLVPTETCRLDVAQGQPIAAALGAMIVFDGVTRLEPAATPIIVVPTGVG
jgi:hypothetical protein